MQPAALAQIAAQRFVDGADASFLTCFHEDAAVYWEPAVSRRPMVDSRAGLEAWLAQVRAEHPKLNVTVTEPTAHGTGAVCEVIVTRDALPDEVWRVALGVCVSDGFIREVRAFWTHDAAVAWVANFR